MEEVKNKTEDMSSTIQNARRKAERAFDEPRGRASTPSKRAGVGPGSSPAARAASAAAAAAAPQEEDFLDHDAPEAPESIFAG